ncbi:MAG: hypothetical protein KAY24_04350 [Candidatus Eisenbacteria sp.]|nr:hypothetical protein [Candidatus Eisenbacteria bacterium]
MMVGRDVDPGVIWVIDADGQLAEEMDLLGGRRRTRAFTSLAALRDALSTPGVELPSAVVFDLALEDRQGIPSETAAVEGLKSLRGAGYEGPLIGYLSAHSSVTSIVGGQWIQLFSKIHHRPREVLNAAGEVSGFLLSR